MSTLAQTWALTAAAIETSGDPHLQPGVHLRVLPGLRIGLPVAPLMVDRVVIGHAGRVGRSTGVVWTGADGEVLTAPFDLGPASPATAWLPSSPGNPVVYAEVLVERARPVRDYYDTWRDLTVRSKALPPWRQPFPPRRQPFPLPKGGVRADAVVSGVLGPAVVASATAAPYQLCATGMDRVVVTGAGRVTGIRVLRARDLKLEPSREPWRLLALPIERGARYEGLHDAWVRAEDRVLRGAPQLLGLHDDPDAPDPATCDPASPSDEWERVKLLWAERLEEMVLAVVDDTGAAPAELMLAPQALTGTAVATATLQVPPLAGALQGAIDPGCGRMLGLVELDDDPPGDPGELVVYVVRGGWTLHASATELLTPLLTPAGSDPADFPLPLPGLVKELQEGQFLDLWTVAAVVRGRAPAPVPRPAVGAPEDLGWVPEVPPSARRHVVLPLSGLVPAAGVAVARETPGVVGLNPRLPDLFPGQSAPDRAVAVVPGVLAEVGPSPAASEAGQGEVHDRGAPEDATDYRLAQADWFGRWSPWATVTVGAGARPPVPVPVLEAAYVDPPAPGGSGRLEVRCMQPRDPDLPPGGLPLDQLIVTASVGGPSPVTGGVAAVRGPAPSGTDAAPLLVSIPVPPLGVGQRRTLSATARWRDTAGRLSAQSPPAAAVAVDPRAPAPLVLPNTLEYAARPDALGRSRVRLSWTATAGQAYRVYVSDETTLRRRLSTLGGSGASVLSALSSVTTAPDRAAVFRSNATLFDRTCFELVTVTPLLATASGPMTFEHEVSGSLRVLVFLKVVPVTVLSASPLLELGGEADFATSTLLVRGIPNSPAPPQPLLTASADPSGSGVRLTVTVPKGQTAPVALRLRRSRVSAADPLAMPVVATVTPVAWPAVLTDTGATPWDGSLRLAPWSTYSWRVEVQGAPEPGSTVPGLWSTASTPASWKVVPTGPPPAATAGSVTSSATGLAVSFAHSEPLDAGPEGDYLFDVYRRTPSGSSVPSGPVGSYRAGPKRQPDGSYLVEDTTTGVPTGTDYLVEVCDPLGRRSARVVVATVT
ncbi:MAG TPA: hypothetical protein VF227_04595 [Actinomycetes bacterium]